MDTLSFLFPAVRDSPYFWSTVTSEPRVKSGKVLFAQLLRVTTSLHSQELSVGSREGVTAMWEIFAFWPVELKNLPFISPSGQWIMREALE